MQVFITGATGFLGKYLVAQLAPHVEKIFVLTRNTSKNSFSHISNVILVKGDITHSDIFSSDTDRLNILNNVDIFVHAAALYDIKGSYSDLYLHNVLGTQNILSLLKKSSALKAFYYVSTIAVADENSYYLDEYSLPERKVFSDYYSQTKYAAEKLVRMDSLKVPLRIIRPGIIVGDSQTGAMEKIDGPYYFIEAIKKLKTVLNFTPYLPLAFNPNTKIPMIPVDHCANCIKDVILKDDYSSDLKTYHLISDEIPTIKKFMGDIALKLGINTKFIPIKNNKISTEILPFLGVPKEVVPFMFSKVSYDKSLTLKDIPALKESRYSDYKDKLIL
jgi:thioester reductase-like protein